MIVHTAMNWGWQRPAIVALGVVCLCAMLFQSSVAQTTDAFADADPVKLFEQGQNAHARANSAKQAEERVENYNRALEYYDEAIKVKPEFPEAEFQRGNVLMSLGRLAEAKTSFLRAIELRKNWAPPYSALAVVLVRLDQDQEAAQLLRQSLQYEPNNIRALQLLGGLLLHAGDVKGALEVSKQATAQPDADAASWYFRALAERATGDAPAAILSLNQVLELDPKNVTALIERAELRINTGAREAGLQDLKAAELSSEVDKKSLARVAAAYESAGMHADAERVADIAGISYKSAGDTHGVDGTPEEINQANSDDPIQSRQALENLLKKNPRNAMLLARLGASYRTVDANRSLDFYRRALDIEPANADFATGYSSALVQGRRFADAVVILRRVLKDKPDNYVAHANLATALYELKQFSDALVEYEWLFQAKPDLVVTHYFIASAHDKIGEYKEALAAYELFLAQASPGKYQLEIEKVKLRLPSLRRQIQRGEGVKDKSTRSGKQ